ncbi:hypothetical protein Tco_1352054 [Tanacetum coccineum]
MVAAMEPKTMQKAVQISGALTDEAVRNGSIKKVEKRRNVREPNKDKNGRDGNKRTRTRNAFAITANPVERENTGAWPKCTTCNSYHASGGPCRTCFNYNRLGERPEEQMRLLMSAKTRDKKQEEIVVVRDFPEVFLDDLLGVPLSREKLSFDEAVMGLCTTMDSNIGSTLQSGDVEILIMVESFKVSNFVHPGADKQMYFDLDIGIGGRFSYNNSYHSSVRCALFEALYGRKFCSPIMWTEVGEGQLIGPELVKPLEFSIGDYVLLKVSPWKGVVRFGKKGKSALDLLTFEIIEKVGLVKSLQSEEFQERGMKCGRIAIVKVRWNSKRGPKFTWEREDQMKLKYLHLFTDDSS